MLRRPAVAGRFYPAQPDKLLQSVRSFLEPVETRTRAIGIVVPHAGYMYSGRVAGAVYARIEVPARNIILCPNHTGYGAPVSIMKSGEWETPLGRLQIDTELCEALLAADPYLQDDVEAHRSEHALEVQIPFLQYVLPDAKFVPITIGTGHWHKLDSLGRAIGEVLKHSGQRTLIIASSDMNHYESDAVTRVKDRKAIDEVLALDPRGLFEVVRRENISMCGYGPAVAMLTAAKALGATRGELVRYATSGDVSEDYDYVVGYAGMIIS